MEVVFLSLFSSLELAVEVLLYISKVIVVRI